MGLKIIDRCGSWFVLCAFTVGVTVGLLAEHWRAKWDGKVVVPGVEIRVDGENRDGKKQYIDWILVDGHRWRVDPPLDSVTHVRGCEKCREAKK